TVPQTPHSPSVKSAYPVLILQSRSIPTTPRMSLPLGSMPPARTAPEFCNCISPNHSIQVEAGPRSLSLLQRLGLTRRLSPFHRPVLSAFSIIITTPLLTNCLSIL